jgi:Rod binding domain-containing protein
VNRIPPSPPNTQYSQRGDNALSAVSTPDKRLPVVDKSKVDPNTLKAAEGMEAMFLDYMMKVMRQTVPKSDMDLENTGTEIYRSMLDSEMAQRAAHIGGVGLADQIVAYLEMQRYNSNQGPQVPRQNQGSSAARPGGTDEGQPIRK